MRGIPRILRRVLEKTTEREFLKFLSFASHTKPESYVKKLKLEMTRSSLRSARFALWSPTRLYKRVSNWKIHFPYPLRPIGLDQV